MCWEILRETFRNHSLPHIQVIYIFVHDDDDDVRLESLKIKLFYRTQSLHSCVERYWERLKNHSLIFRLYIYSDVCKICTRRRRRRLESPKNQALQLNTKLTLMCIEYFERERETHLTCRACEWTILFLKFFFYFSLLSFSIDQSKISFWKDSNEERRNSETELQTLTLWNSLYLWNDEMIR